MKVRIINKHGNAWDFDSVREAKQHLKMDDDFGFFELQEINGESVRVYDDRNLI